ncbi:MAG: hypothetical protein HQL53_01090 [Magnetococcales bacterium]|nr:hypothetical protein [Magnetococcales bacterium]
MSELKNHDMTDSKTPEGQSEQDAVLTTRRDMLKKFGAAALAVSPLVISSTAQAGLPTVGTRI